MTGSPSSIIMLGLGNGTFAGSPSLLITLGYGVGDATNALTGQWSHVISCQSNQPRIASHHFNPRITTKAETRV